MRHDNMIENSDCEGDDGDLVREILRWEDNGGQNVGPGYEWLPTTSKKRANQRKSREPHGNLNLPNTICV